MIQRTLAFPLILLLFLFSLAPARAQAPQPPADQSAAAAAGNDAGEATPAAATLTPEEYRYELRRLFVLRQYEDVLRLADEAEQAHPNLASLEFYRDQARRRMAEVEEAQDSLRARLQRPITIETPRPTPTPIPTPKPPERLAGVGAEAPAGEGPALGRRDFKDATAWILALVAGGALLAAAIVLTRRRKTAQTLARMEAEEREEASGAASAADERPADRFEPPMTEAAAEEPAFEAEEASPAEAPIFDEFAEEETGEEPSIAETKKSGESEESADEIFGFGAEGAAESLFAEEAPVAAEKKESGDEDLPEHFEPTPPEEEEEPLALKFGEESDEAQPEEQRPEELSAVDFAELGGETSLGVEEEKPEAASKPEPPAEDEEEEIYFQDLIAGTEQSEPAVGDEPEREEESAIKLPARDETVLDESEQKAPWETDSSPETAQAADDADLPSLADRETGAPDEETRLEDVPAPEFLESEAGLEDQGDEEATVVSPSEEEDEAPRPRLEDEDTDVLGATRESKQEGEEPAVFREDETVSVSLGDEETRLDGGAEEKAGDAAGRSETRASAPDEEADASTESFDRERNMGFDAFENERWDQAVHHLSIAAALRPEAGDVKDHLRKARRMRKQKA